MILEDQRTITDPQFKVRSKIVNRMFKVSPVLGVLSSCLDLG